MKKTLALLLAVVMCFGLAACGGSSAPASSGSSGASSGETLTLKLTHCQADGHPIDEGADLVAKLMEERTNGRVKIDVYPANMLGAESVTRDMVKEGTVDIVLLGSAANNYNKAMNLAMSFYLIQSIPECDYMLFESDFAKKYMHEDFEANHNVVYLDSWSQSSRQTMTTKPFRTPEDLKSIKLRVPAGIPVWETAWNKMGAMTVSMGLDDAFSGLQQGVCDGVEGPIDQMYFYSFQEIAKNYITTNHCFYSYQFLMNKDSYNKLTDEEKKILDECLAEGKVTHDKLRDENVTKLVDDMVQNAGVTVVDLTDAERQAFADLANQAIQESMSDWGEECYNDFMTEVEAWRKAH